MGAWSAFKSKNKVVLSARVYFHARSLATESQCRNGPSEQDLKVIRRILRAVLGLVLLCRQNAKLKARTVSRNMQMHPFNRIEGFTAL